MKKQTNAESFDLSEPKVDGFRNFLCGKDGRRRSEESLIDWARLLTLSAPEMTVLVGGQKGP